MSDVVEVSKENVWTDIQVARLELDAAIEQLQSLLEALALGGVNLAAATALAHVVNARVALHFREPAVPFRLAFQLADEEEGELRGRVGQLTSEGKGKK